MNILKFGGSSVSNSCAIKKTSDIILNTKKPIVVTSAFYGITDKLIDIISYAKKQDETTLNQKMLELTDHHFSIAKNLNIPFNSSELENLSKGPILDILNKRQVAPSAHDRIVGTGEKIAANILSSYLNSMHPSTVVNKSIITDDNFGNAKPLMNACSYYALNTIEPLVKTNIIPVVPGFIGSTFKGAATTLGRGGSDLTATVLGQCLNAENILFYKVECDKDGQWEPGYIGIIHPDGKTIPFLTFAEMYEMCKYGRKVLHEDTIIPIMNNKKINIFIKNTFEPSKQGTLITAQRTSSPSDITTSFYIEKEKATILIKENINPDLAIPYKNAIINKHSIYIKNYL